MASNSAPTHEGTADVLSYIVSLVEHAYLLRRWLDDEAERVAGVTFSQYLVLTMLRKNAGQLTISQVAQLLARTGQTATSIADSLERLGLARRKRFRNSDRRQVWLSITRAGREMLTSVAGADPEMAYDLVAKLRGEPDTLGRLRDAAALVQELLPNESPTA